MFISYDGGGIISNLGDGDPGQRLDWPVLWIIERNVHILCGGHVIHNLGVGYPGQRLDWHALWMIERNVHILWCGWSNL